MDGQTEQFYLQHLKKLKGYKYKVYPSLFDDISIDIVENKIDELLSGGCDLIVYFTDYDVIVNQDKYIDFKELARKYENVTEVIICESMPSIEFWFLIHYKKTTKEFRNADEVCRDLKNYIPAFSKSKNFLKSAKWVEQLCGDGKLELACNNAKEILKEKKKGNVGTHFPFTNAHIGIDYFNKKNES